MLELPGGAQEVSSLIDSGTDIDLVTRFLVATLKLLQSEPAALSNQGPVDTDCLPGAFQRDGKVSARALHVKTVAGLVKWAWAFTGKSKNALNALAGMWSWHSQESCLHL